MKQKLFVFICLLALVTFSGCGLNQCDTPEEVITKLHSGELKSADEVREITYLAEGNNNLLTTFGDEVYYFLGFKNRADYENEVIKRILNIDHVDDLKIEKIPSDAPQSYYKLNGTIHGKDGSTEILNNRVVSVVSRPNGKGKTEYLYNISPLFERISFRRYNTVKDGDKLFETQLSAYYCGNTICFMIVIENFSDNEYILSDWPKGANIIWGDRSDRIRNPVIINSKDNPAGQLSLDKGKYHAVIMSYFVFDKIVTPEEAYKLLIKNNSLTINYLTKGENGLPSMNFKKQPFIYDDIAH